jgi:hypothetical protein
MPRCNFTKKNGEACLAWAVNGHEKCVFHVEGDVRKALRERPLSKEEQVVIISRQIKSVQKNVKNSLEKAMAIRSLVLLLKELQEGKPPDDGNDKADPLKSKLDQWNKSRQS